MRWMITLVTVMIFGACGQHEASNKVDINSTDTLKTPAINQPDLPSPSVAETAGPKPTVTKLYLDSLFRTKGGKWKVVDDHITRWPKDIFDYFVLPKRQKDPDYPYIARGDFNIDGKPDYAALVVNAAGDTYRLAIVLDTATISVWNEDTRGAAIERMPKADLGGIDGKIVKLQGDGVNVEYYEKSSYVVYWAGTAFKKVWTGD